MKHYINGKWTNGSGELFQSTDPVTANILWEGQEAEAAEVDAAVSAAHAAFPAWSRLAYSKRLEYIEAFCAQVDANREELGALIARETGKVLWDALGEVNVVAGRGAISKASFEERAGEKQKDLGGGLSSQLAHRAHGVMAIYGPYNFPAHLPNAHMMPALLAGNTLVVKPSEQAPAVAEFLFILWEKVGLPKGVVNLVQGGLVTGVALAANQSLAGILFTGSYATGKKLHEGLAGRPEVMLALEMGGNNPLVIWDAENVDAAADLAIQSAYITSGQRCTCARRLILPKGTAGDKLIETLIARMKHIQIGLPFDEVPPFMGPLINEATAELLLGAQKALLDAGATSLVKMERLNDDVPLISPALIDVTTLVEREDTEYFGPLLQVIRVDDFDAAMLEANNTAYGLSASLVTDNDALWERFLSEARAGVVNRNRPTSGASGNAPFGGVGHSGNLRPTAYYAVDYCAYPVASLVKDEVVADVMTGLNG